MREAEEIDKGVGGASETRCRPDQPPFHDDSNSAQRFNGWAEMSARNAGNLGVS